MKKEISKDVLEFHRKATYIQMDYLSGDKTQKESIEAIKELYENYKDIVPIEELNFYTNEYNKGSDKSSKK